MEHNNSLTTDNWKGRLKFDRVCASAGPLDRCWLITELSAWNRVLYGLNYELVETCPGKLSLRYAPSSAAGERREAAASEAAFLISWLVENHGCIDELHIVCAVYPEDTTPEQVPATIRLHPPPGKGIRSLYLEMCAGSRSYCYLPDEEIEALRDIEEVELRCCEARPEAGLVKLLRSNSKSLKCVRVFQRELSQSMADALQHLDSCVSLTVSKCVHSVRRWNSHTTTRIIQGLAGVQNFRCCAPPDSQCNIPAIADALRTNANLTTLELRIHRSGISPKELYAALESNASLQTLIVCCGNHDASCGDALASALRRNTCLLDLQLIGIINMGFVGRLAEGLSQNTTLEKLMITCDMEGVLQLCDVLRTNTTLKKMVLPAFPVYKEQRLALAQKLAHGNCYSRVRLSYLEDCDMLPLSRLLACPTSGPEELGELHLCRISGGNFRLLCDALASNIRVQELNINVGTNAQAKTQALCGMLRVNRSITRISIAMPYDEDHFVDELLSALDENKNISQMMLAIHTGPEIETASTISNFLSRNRMITTFQTLIGGLNDGHFLEVVSRGVAMNPVILEFETLPGQDTNCLISDTLRRNRSSLNRAVDFALQHAKDKGCAEAFELFSGRPCLLSHVVKTSGKTEREALQALASAENFLRENYLVIAGVVRRCVVCHPVSGGTQCDELNAECWHAIVRHLRVSDVLG